MLTFQNSDYFLYKQLTFIELTKMSISLTKIEHEIVQFEKCY